MWLDWFNLLDEDISMSHGPHPKLGLFSGMDDPGQSIFTRVPEGVAWSGCPLPLSTNLLKVGLRGAIWQWRQLLLLGFGWIQIRNLRPVLCMHFFGVFMGCSQAESISTPDNGSGAIGRLLGNYRSIKISAWKPNYFVIFMRSLAMWRTRLYIQSQSGIGCTGLNRPFFGEPDDNWVQISLIRSGLLEGLGEELSICDV